MPRKFSGEYSHRTIEGGIGHNLPQEAPDGVRRAPSRRSRREGAPEGKIEPCSAARTTVRADGGACRSRVTLPAFDGATGWLNSPPLTAAGLRGQRRAGRLLDLHLHQLAAHPALCPRLGRQVQGSRAGGDRRPYARVRRSSTTSATSAGPSRTCGSSTRSRSTTTTRSGAPSTTTTGRRCTSSTRRDAFATTTSARATTTDPRRSSSSCWPRPEPAASARTWWRSSPWGGGRRRLGQPVVAGKLPRLRAHRELRLGRWAVLDTPHVYAVPDTVAAQPVGAVG